ncbi:MAG: DNA polymerase III subunit delta [Planctomycetota bacterium]|jgi:DNA polymerase-3 subunit delta
MSAARRRPADPGSQYREALARLEAGEPPRLMLLLPPTSGEEESWFAERLVAAARAWAQGIGDCDLLDLDGASPDFRPEDLDAFLGSQSLFATRKVLLLQRAAKALNRWPRLGEALLEAATAADGPEAMLVHVGGSGKGAQKLSATRRKGIEKLRFRSLYGDPPPWKPEPDESEAAQFTRAEAQARGIRLERGAAGLIVQMAGSRAADLIGALDHLGMLGLEQAGEDEVRQVVAHSAEGTAFDLADAYLAGDAGKVLTLLRRIARQGLRSWDGRRLAAREAFGMVLGAVARELARTAQVLDEVAAGRSVSEAIEAGGSRASMPVVRRMETRLRMTDASGLARLRRGILDAERQVKREGWRDGTRALELLALKSFRHPAAGARA